MDEVEFLKLIKNYVINIAISGSTLRNQGAPGVVDAARKFLRETLDLNSLNDTHADCFQDKLNDWTKQQKDVLPPNAQNWGTARKTINVFLIQAFMNKYLNEKYGLEEFRDVFEIPLDSYTTKELRRRAGRGQLPGNFKIITLQENDNTKYQDYAHEVAKNEEIPRACLDIVFWRTNDT